MRITARLTVGLRSLKELRDGRRQSSRFKHELKQIGQTLGTAVADRFERFSKGEGDWRKIKPETARRKGNTRILVDSGDLLRGIRQGVWTNVSYIGSRVTITAQLRARRQHRSGLPMQELIRIHHFGLGRVPARKILVRPSPAVFAQARRRLTKIAREATKET